MKRTILIVVLVCVLVSSGAVPIRQARADILGVDVTWEIFGNWLWKSLLASLRKRILDLMVDDIITWIQGGGKPRFITNYSDFVNKAIDAAAGDVLKSELGFLCSPFGAQVRFSLFAVPTFSEQVQCTLSGAMTNIQNFYLDFSAGGWDGYYAHWLPQNNYFGATLIARTEQERRAAEVLRIASAEATASRGFLSEKVCEEALVCDEPVLDELGVTVCFKNAFTKEPVGAGWKPLAVGEKCVKERIITPGSFAGDAAAKAFGSQIDSLIGLNSNDLSQYVAAITNALVNRITTSFTNGAQAGLAEARNSKGVSGDSAESARKPDQRLGEFFTAVSQVGRAVGSVAGQLLNLVGKIFEAVGRVCFHIVGARVCLWDITGGEFNDVKETNRNIQRQLAIDQCTSDITTKNLRACGNRMITAKKETATAYASSTALFTNLVSSLNTLAELAGNASAPSSCGATTSTTTTAVALDDFIRTKRIERDVLQEYGYLFDFAATTRNLADEITAIDRFISSRVGDLPVISSGSTLTAIIGDLRATKVLAEAGGSSPASLAYSLISTATRLRFVNEFTSFLDTPAIVNKIDAVAVELEGIADNPGTSQDVAKNLNLIIEKLINILNELNGLPKTTQAVTSSAVASAFDQLAAILTRSETFNADRAALAARITPIITALQEIPAGGLSPESSSAIDGVAGTLRTLRTNIAAVSDARAFTERRSGFVSSALGAIVSLQEITPAPPTISAVSQALVDFQGALERMVTAVTAFPPVYDEQNAAEQQFAILDDVLGPMLTTAQDQIAACTPPPLPLSSPPPTQ
ncbi:MAG: hypothetical protein HYS43_01925 [Candidatus Liptonbacteria bacterium]|nr:hypothetical protein [Candidatus Liptonbacteria bacterium]